MDVHVVHVTSRDVITLKWTACIYPNLNSVCAVNEINLTFLTPMIFIEYYLVKRSQQYSMLIIIVKWFGLKSKLKLIWTLWLNVTFTIIPLHCFMSLYCNFNTRNTMFEKKYAWCIVSLEVKCMSIHNSDTQFYISNLEWNASKIFKTIKVWF